MVGGMGGQAQEAMPPETVQVSGEQLMGALAVKQLSAGSCVQRMRSLVPSQDVPAAPQVLLQAQSACSPLPLQT